MWGVSFGLFMLIHNVQDEDIAMVGSRKIDKHRIITGREAEFFQLLDEAMDVGVSIMDENFQYLYINRFAADTLQLEAGEFQVGDPLSKVHRLMVEKNILSEKVFTDSHISADDTQSAYNSGEDQTKNLTTFTDGRTHRLVRKHTEDGYTISINHDVTELLKKEQMLQKALELGNSGYWVFNFKTKQIELSASMRAMLTPEEIDLIRSKGVMAIIHKEDHEAFITALRDVRASDDTINFIHRNLDGNKWYRTTGNSERDENGKLSSLRAFMKDITQETLQAQELERAKDEAIAANIAKSEFLANMSHEIRTPMNGVLGMAELLEESDIDDRQREFVKVINKSSNALLTIINDILDFSKIEAGAFELDPVSFNLRDAINDVASLLSTSSKEKGLELIINYPPQLESMFIADVSRIRQIITNLVGNAIKFTEVGHVLIDVGVKSYTETRAEITFAIVDTGIGIEAEKLERIFEKFTQADNSTTRVYGGTGLGLSISKRIVELMGGSMKVKSTYGAGSTFEFTIAAPIDTNAKRSAPDISSLKGINALIVDDIAINRNILQERLQAWKMRSSAAKSGVDALAAIKNAHDDGNPFDVILLDYLMPGMNGQELATLLTVNPLTSDIPIIMLSSCDQPISSQELNSIGITSFLVKPVRETQLHKNLVRVLSEHRKTVQPSSQPPAASKEYATMTNANQTPDQPIQKIKILVAEDFPLNQDVVRLMLQDTHYLPAFANNGQEAVNMFKATPKAYAAILMDISMPVMDGFEAAGRIHAFQDEMQQPRTPIIALTGHALKHDKEKCIDAGMNDYLSKPVKHEYLMEALNKWVMGGVDQIKIA